jgi:ATP-dependent RNA helicase RhlE
MIQNFDEDTLNYLIASKTHYNLANLEHNFVFAGDQNKLKLLDSHLKSIYKTKQNPFIVIFANSIKCVRALDYFLKKLEYKCNTLHGELPISLRAEIHDNFKNKRINILIATDLAARGLNFESVEYVINFDFPLTPNDYLHR